MKAPFSSSRIPEQFGKPDFGLRRRLYTVIFEADTHAGWLFDVVLVIAILLSILVVVLDSLHGMHVRYGRVFNALEWGFTLLFTVEYVARLVCVQRPLYYATSFYGIVDLLAVLPTYLALVFPGTSLLLDIRILRLLRVFRIFKLSLYVAEYSTLALALRASRRKIAIFLSVVLMLVLILGTLMYVVEGPESGYTSIPVAMYWAVVTMTTVGYGDITPHTAAGKLIASMMMLLGWGILAVPTGIVTSELAAQRFYGIVTTRRCPTCLSEGHEASAKFCKDCGTPLPPSEPKER
ncbi:MAG TPA: ion transporter [Burkholderiaceae bacterium]|nr:ion transporter [Burkholderiaceae bacterium]